MLTRVRRHWPLAAVLALASVLIFTGLGGDYLWSDEGDTAVLARSVLRNGVPTAWDGTTFTDSDAGARLNDDLVMVSHPWLQYYVTAASFALLGDSPWAARLPFALLGLLTIALAYALAFRASAHRWTAASAALLLTLSVQFLLYARQSRHYTLNAALTCLLVLQFSRLTSWRGSAVFALISILLFHSHPIALAPVCVFAMLVTFHEPSKQYRRWFWRAMPLIAVFTLPWLSVAHGGYAPNVGFIRSVSQFLPRLGQFLVECASVTAIPGLLGLAFVLWRRSRRRPSGDVRGQEKVETHTLAHGEQAIVVTLGAIVLMYGVAMAATQPRDTIWSIGLRYTPAVLPFMAIIAGILIARTSRYQWRIWVALLLVFGFTKLGRLTPYTFWESPMARRDKQATVAFHNPERWPDRVFRTGQLGYLRSLVEPNPGTTAQVVEFLKAHAAEQDVVVTNYGWEPLYFHTKLKLGMTVLPSYPIYSAAKARQLPNYVFSPVGARWIVWRRNWGAYRGHSVEQLLAWLQQSRVPFSLVTTIPETVWENRENIHFRRFPGNHYIYPWFEKPLETLIFRVDWPKGQS